MKTGKGLSENASYKVVALLITLILWVIILGSKEATITKMIPANYLLPKDMVIVNMVPHEVAFRISGPRLTLKRFTENIEPLAIDLTSSPEGLTTIRIHPDSIDIPPGLRVPGLSPTTITPRLEKILTRSVPIKVDMKGTLPPGRQISKVTVLPPTWEISGARSVVENVKELKTEPVDLTDVQSSVTRELGLAVDNDGIVKTKDAHVRVELGIK